MWGSRELGAASQGRSGRGGSALSLQRQEGAQGWRALVPYVWATSAAAAASREVCTPEDRSAERRGLWMHLLLPGHQTIG